MVMKKHNVKKVIFSSTATVYGEPEVMPIKETFLLDPKSPYARTKFMIEEILRDEVLKPSPTLVVQANQDHSSEQTQPGILEYCVTLILLGHIPQGCSVRTLMASPTI